MERETMMMKRKKQDKIEKMGEGYLITKQKVTFARKNTCFLVTRGKDYIWRYMQMGVVN